MIISFGYVEPAIQARRKCTTLRDWNWRHAEKFYDGMVVDGYDRSPRAGGKKTSEIIILGEPEIFCTSHLNDAHYETEGFRYLDEIGDKGPMLKMFLADSYKGVLETWRDMGDILYLVRFKIHKTHDELLSDS